MRKLIALLLFVSTGGVTAAPFLISDVLPAAVTQCGIFMDATPEVVIPVTMITGGNICKYDVSGVSVGSHTVTATSFFVNDPVWGSQESAKSLPLSFVRPVAPGLPTGLKLQP